MGLTMLFMLVLICLGAVYITVYEKAPIHERLYILMVGSSMYIGVITWIIEQLTN
jgi:hypothetical protein